MASKRWVVCVCVLAGLMALPGHEARALDILGFLGLGDKTPAPSPTTYPYQLTVEAPGAPKDVRQAAEDASNLSRLKTEAPGAADQLVRIAEADLPRITDALWGLGYYSASVVIDVAGVPLALGAMRSDAAARAAEAYRGRALVPVRIVVQAGPQYRFRNIVVLDDATGLPFIRPMSCRSASSSCSPAIPPARPT